jgi:hypothetical protein
MDTAEAAHRLGTTPRMLRQFLRSPMSTFVAVGSGSRYEFDERDVDTLRKRFSEWQGAGKPKPVNVSAPKPAKPNRGDKQKEMDRQVWEEEGPVAIEDIRDPRVRARVQANAQAAEERLNMRLLAAGLHITQLGDRQSA